MQSEAGQALDAIIRRKELERVCGHGIFYWGIGNALGQSVRVFTQRVSHPEVLFSVMRSHPKPQDAHPVSLLLWTGYVDAKGLVVPLPDHVLLLSRKETATGIKQRHYALVCHSTGVLASTSHGKITSSHLKNMLTRSRIGHSQVTAIVEHVTTDDNGAIYDINMRVQLLPPYVVRLAESRDVLPRDRQLIEDIVTGTPDSQAWLAHITALRRRPEYECHCGTPHTLWSSPKSP